eukprot:712404-Rhodomonas_salina.5
MHMRLAIPGTDLARNLSDIVVVARDAGRNQVKSFSGMVNLAFSRLSGTQTNLTGTFSKVAAEGLVRFNDLYVSYGTGATNVIVLSCAYGTTMGHSTVLTYAPTLLLRAVRY